MFGSQWVMLLRGDLNHDIHQWINPLVDSNFDAIIGS
jgi:hypothetical protein